LGAVRGALRRACTRVRGSLDQARCGERRQRLPGRLPRGPVRGTGGAPPWRGAGPRPGGHPLGTGARVHRAGLGRAARQPGESRHAPGLRLRRDRARGVLPQGAAVTSPALAVLVILYGATSLLHFTHNAEFLALYPNLPPTWTRAEV